MLQLSQVYIVEVHRPWSALGCFCLLLIGDIFGTTIPSTLILLCPLQMVQSRMLLSSRESNLHWSWGSMIYEVQAERRPKITVDVVNAVPYRGKILMLFRQRIIDQQLATWFTGQSTWKPFTSFKQCDTVSSTEIFSCSMNRWLLNVKAWLKLYNLTAFSGQMWLAEMSDLGLTVSPFSQWRLPH